MSNLVGRQLDRYRIDALLGQGGMGAVYYAYDLNLTRFVSLKVMHEHLGREPEFRQRFWKEAQVAARLDHTSIVRVYDFGDYQDLLYLVMAYVPGLSLRAALRQAQTQGQLINLSEGLTVLAQMADALDYAHRQGVVHRDIKPDNVLLQPLPRPDRDGEPPIRAMVTDFGLAKILEGDFSTQSGTLMGTLSYMSPEHILGEAVDGRSDLYAVGVMLYEMATGRLPFQIKSPTDAVIKHLRETPPPPQTVRPELPAAVADLITTAIARDPHARFQTGAEMAAALRQAAKGLAGLSVVAPTAEPTLSLVQSAQLSVSSLPAPELPLTLLPEPLAAPEPREQLLIECADQPAQRIPLTQSPLTIGRAEHNQIVLAGNGISRTHVRLERTASGWYVTDLGSTNGTLLDEQHLNPHTPYLWTAGAYLQLGPCRLQWVVASLATVAAPAPLFAVPPSGSPQPSVGVNRARSLPLWLAAVVAVVVLAACLSVAALLSFVNERDAAATATLQAVAQQTAIVGTQWAVDAQTTATAAAAATAVAATATAEQARLLGDDDGDGLTNEEEQQWNTDPNRPDTDGDGLIDGVEVNQYRSNPLQVDSDGDGMNDGAEVNAGRNPIMPETPTPTATLTPSPTVTRLPVLTPTPSATPTITPSPTPSLQAQQLQAWDHDLRLLAGQRRYSLLPASGGPVNLTLTWDEPGPAALQAQLVNPQTGDVVAEAGGGSPLELAYTLTGAELLASPTWDIVIQHTEDLPVAVSLRLSYPDKGSSGSMTDSFLLATDTASHVSLLELTDAGILIARANWSGISPDALSLSIYSAARPQPYTQQSGPPPLNVNYRVLPADWAASELWWVELTSPAPADAHGSMNLLYP